MANEKVANLFIDRFHTHTFHCKDSPFSITLYEFLNKASRAAKVHFSNKKRRQKKKTPDDGDIVEETPIKNEPKSDDCKITRLDQVKIYFSTELRNLNDHEEKLSNIPLNLDRKSKKYVITDEKSAIEILKSEIHNHCSNICQHNYYFN